ncbi:XRE family transcriptional regulator [Pseudomonas putida]|uniref:helix-turn-helix domain-containing protein n=1 Tax=Pseudomonas putida TaxID=303 RepID=UPI0007B6D6A9|nr:helix-turn-helix transcriptional regulator [Pseudomonas putida]ANC00655.1 XRE family transcriptional regulator [Pseudomonas putida]
MLIADGVGNRLREERERLGLSQEEFGVRVGVSRGTQKKYELGTGSSSMDLKYLTALEAFGVDTTYIVTASRTLPAGLSSEEADLLEQYRAIPEQDRRSLRRFLKAMFQDATS